MTRFIWLLGAALGFAVQNIDQSHATQVVHFESAAPAPATGTRSTADRPSLWGHLSRPEGDGPFPVVVLLHGCAGLQPSHFRWAGFLNRLGYLTLLVDSFGPRSIVRNCTRDTTPEDLADRQLDALGAHAYLLSRPDVDPDRVALAGWSQGATIALDLFAKQQDTLRQQFRSAVAFYPDCMPGAEFSRPVLVMIGEADDWSSVEQCRQMADHNQEHGMVRLIVYPRVFHAFDVSEIADGLPGPSGKRWIKYDPRAYQDSMFQIQTFLSLTMPPR